MASKSQLLKTFLNQINDFIEDLLSIYEEDKVLLRGKLYFDGLRKANPSFIIKVWHNRITVKYGHCIEKGEVEQFLTKDLSDDLKDASAPDINMCVSQFQNMMIKIFDMSDDNKEKSIRYIQNCVKLSKMYFNT